MFEASTHIEVVPTAAAPSSTKAAAPVLTAELEVFTTARILHLYDDRFELPLLGQHARRLEEGLRRLLPPETPAIQAAEWQTRINQAAQEEVRVQAAQAAEKGVPVMMLDRRMKISARVADQAHRIEFFGLDMRAPLAMFAPSVWSLLTPPLDDRPTVALSPRPLSADEARSPSLLIKTSHRDIYATHTTIASEKHPGIQSVLLYVHRPSLSVFASDPADPDESLFLTESTIANLLFLPPTADGQNATPWLTPRLSTTDTPLLPGLQRAMHLERGEAKERDISVAQAKRWLADGGRIACANALRGVWDVRVMWD